MNITDLTTISPTIGKLFARYLNENEISAEGMEFKVMPPYVDESLGNVIAVQADIDGQTASLGMSEAASSDEYAALLDAVA